MVIVAEAGFDAISPRPACDQLLRQDLDAVARAGHGVLDLLHHLLHVSSSVGVDAQAERSDIDRPDTVIRRQDGIDHAAQDLAVEVIRTVARVGVDAEVGAARVQLVAEVDVQAALDRRKVVHKADLHDGLRLDDFGRCDLIDKIRVKNTQFISVK